MKTARTAIFTPRGVRVEIQDVFECGGKELAVIKALDGKPFADGAKTTTNTAFLTVILDDLDDCTCTPRDTEACTACKAAAEALYGDSIPVPGLDDQNEQLSRIEELEKRVRVLEGKVKALDEFTTWR